MDKLMNKRINRTTVITLCLLLGIILTAVTPRANADIYTGAGVVVRVPGLNENPSKIVNLSIKWEQGDVEYPWFVGLVGYQPYVVYRSPVDSHAVLSLGKRIVSWDLTDDTEVYLDFGVAIPSVVSFINSSHIQFYEEGGVRYKDYRLLLSHQSNAGLKGANEGETSVRFEYRWDF